MFGKLKILNWDGGDGKSNRDWGETYNLGLIVGIGWHAFFSIYNALIKQVGMVVSSLTQI